MGGTGLQDHLDDPGGQASRENKGSQGPLASGQAFEALKETRGTLAPLETLAKWASRGPVVSWVPLAARDRRAARATRETSMTSIGQPSQP